VWLLCPGVKLGVIDQEPVVQINFEDPEVGLRRARLEKLESIGQQDDRFAAGQISQHPNYQVERA
jgi:hypothetical protein